MDERRKRVLQAIGAGAAVVAALAGLTLLSSRALAPAGDALPGLARSSRPAQPAPPSPPAPPDAAADAGKPLPGRRAFAGSAKCGECHARELDGWRHDWHSRALAKATPQSVAGKFPAHFKGASSEAWMTRDGGRFAMRTLGPDGRVGTFPVDWVVGGKRMQDGVTVFPDGRWQVLPVYFHVTGGGAWVDYTEAKQGVLGPDHPFFWSNYRRTANRECLDCHVSGLDASLDRATRRWTTRFADAGVACESCHGPGARHAQTQDPRDVFQPAKAGGALAFAACAQCHGPRSPLFGVLDAKDRFAAGDRYEDFYQPLVVVDGHSRSGDFFADGRPKTSSFEATALAESLCMRKGGATCLSCHTAPHAPSKRDEVKWSPGERATSKGKEVAQPKPPMAFDLVSCAGCHGDVFAQREKHTHHGPGVSCLDCHMPKVVSGVLDHFADHSLDVPVPENTQRHGVPNACNACHAHAKAPPAKMAEAIARWFPGSRRKERRIQLADAIDEATGAQSEPALSAVVADGGEAPELRGAAMELFAQRFSRDAAPALVAQLAAPDPLVRAKACQGLAEAGARFTADAVAAALGDASLQVRQSCALALATFSDPRGTEALRRLALDPATADLPQPHVMLGVAAARAGDLVDASAELERAIDLKPYFAEALVMLADVYARRGDRVMARRRLEELLSFEPANAAALERLRLLDGK